MHIDPIELSECAALDLAQRQSLIANHPLLSRLTLEEMAELARLMFERRYGPGEVIVTEGDLVDSVYLIAEGSVEVTRKVQRNGKSETLFLSVLSEGEAFGLNETGFFAPGEIRTATVTALSSTLVLDITLTDFRQFIAEHPRFGADTQAAADLMLRMNFIKQATPFANLTLSRIRWLAQHVEEVTIPAGSMIFNRGDLGEKCYLIRSGKIEIFIPNADGTEKLLAELGPPAILGEVALLRSAPRNASARVKENCELFVLHRKDLMDIMGVESSASQVLNSLLKERSRPVRHEGITYFHKQTSDGQTITTLKNPLNGRFFRVAPDGWFIWQLIDGTNSIKDITQKYTEKFRSYNPDQVSALIFDLADNGFIELGSLNFQASNNNNIWTDKITWLAIIIGLAAIIGSITYILYDLYYNHAGDDKKASGYVALAPIVKHVLVIDLDYAGSVDQQTVLNGSTPILAIHQGHNANNHDADVIDFLSEFSQLVLFDSDKNGRIDAHDPLFTRLELVFLKPDGKIERHVPMSETGIRALSLNKAELVSHALQQNVNKMLDVVNWAIMSDGSTREMKVILLEDRYLP